MRHIYANTRKPETSGSCAKNSGWIAHGNLNIHTFWKDPLSKHSGRVWFSMNLRRFCYGFPQVFHESELRVEVQSPYGHFFERKTLEKWFANCGSVGPWASKHSKSGDHSRPPINDWLKWRQPRDEDQNLPIFHNISKSSCGKSSRIAPKKDL